MGLGGGVGPCGLPILNPIHLGLRAYRVNRASSVVLGKLSLCMMLHILRNMHLSSFRHSLVTADVLRTRCYFHMRSPTSSYVRSMVNQGSHKLREGLSDRLGSVDALMS